MNTLAYATLPYIMLYSAVKERREQKIHPILTRGGSLGRCIKIKFIMYVCVCGGGLVSEFFFCFFF